MKIKIVPDVYKEMEETDKYVRDVIDGKVPIDKNRAEKTHIMTPDTFAKVFTPERIRLMMRIRKNELTNIYQLAKELDRPYEAVHRDITYLKGMGIVKIKNKDKTKIPYIEDELIAGFAIV